MKILILGGTSESRELARALDARSDVDVTLSLAGRTASPRPQGVTTRIGGFGGVRGLARFIDIEEIGILIDATHPYADRISVNAMLAARETDVQFLALRRAPWQAISGDRWVQVNTVDEAVSALGSDPVRAFLALGRQDIMAFADAPQHTYLVRSVDPIEPPLPVPHATYVTARGPFDEAKDRATLERHDIEIIVAKNSGGDASYGKIAAARALHIPVIMIGRPALPEAQSVNTVAEALAWCDHALTLAAMRGV